MVDITDPKGAKREIEQEAYRHYEQLSGTTLARRPDGTFQSQGHNDELDAFRHAYTSGRVTQLALGQQWIARKFGDDAEIGPAHPNDPYEHRMDLWNNEAGRRLGDQTSGQDELARQAYAALRHGDLATGLNDPRLRQLFPDDPRLARPQGDPERDLVTGSDVDRINKDVSRLQDRSHDRFPVGHPDRAYFDTLRGQLPGSVSDAKVAEAMLVAKQAGIERVDQLAGAALRDDQIFVAGKTPGFRAQLDATMPAPEMRDSIYLADQHNAVRSYDQAAQSQVTPHTPGR
ncbi:hypothetical protein [Xanthomonas sp. 3058]|uniref:DUF6973 domain-containing protein n=1 Tax=Xanthomonas sp. 3058 TaxID=3035314 RepID=UPI001623118A|nr:hypothetical protein [Xanthomonas sp. 3058]MBB5866600.1 hypothetical protein [Xanthomonas sp. 3058]